MVNVFLKLFGIKTVLRLGWKHLLYPKLKEWAQDNAYPEWDEALVELLNKNIHKLIELA